MLAPLLDVEASFSVAGAGYCDVRFCSIFKNNGRRAAFEEDLRIYIFRGRRSARDMFIRDVRRWGRWFPERGCILEHQIFRFGKMILRDRCSTSYGLASLLPGRRSTLDRWSLAWKNRKTHWHEAASSALNFLFLKEVSQNCCVFDAVKFKNWGRLAELSRFWCCQVQKLRKYRRIAAFSSFQLDRQTERKKETDR